jgi:hypothetical protein
MNASRHFFYWVLPTAYVLALVVLYFAGGPVVRSVLVPEFNRELGLVESTQHLLILAVIWLCWRGFRQAQDGWERAGFVLALALATLQFLEEINYGQHYLMALQGVSRDEFTSTWSLHNRDGVSSRLKSLADLLITAWFVLLPMLAGRRAPAWLRYLAPPRLIIVTVLCALLVSKLAHLLNDADLLQDHRLGKSISEFREIFVYYIGLLYVHELVYRRRWPGWKGEHGTPLPETRA